MLGGIKRVNVLPGKENEFEQLFKQLKASVRANEAGNEYYDLYKSQTEPGKYVVMERYRDSSALNMHKNSTYGTQLFPKIRALLESIEVEYFDSIE